MFAFESIKTRHGPVVSSCRSRRVWRPLGSAPRRLPCVAGAPEACVRGSQGPLGESSSTSFHQLCGRSGCGLLHRHRICCCCPSGLPTAAPASRPPAPHLCVCPAGFLGGLHPPSLVTHCLAVPLMLRLTCGGQAEALAGHWGPTSPSMPLVTHPPSDHHQQSPEGGGWRVRGPSLTGQPL